MAYQLLLVMGPGQNFLIRIGPGRVNHLWFGLEFGKFRLKMSNFSIFYPSGQKNLFGLGPKVHGSKVGRPLIYCGLKVSSGRVGSGPISSCSISLISYPSFHNIFNATVNILSDLHLKSLQ